MGQFKVYDPSSRNSAAEALGFPLMIGNRGHHHPRRLPTHLPTRTVVFPPSRISSKKSKRRLEGLPTVALSAATPRQEQANDTASIATVRPPSRLSATSPTPGLKPSQLALNRQRSAASGIGYQASGAGLIGAGSGAGGGDNSSIASSGPISPSDAEDLAVAFRQAMRKAGDQ
jgi:hypothetical protein